MDNFESKGVREKYISGEIMQVGDLVEDLNTGEILQILDRGSNYITTLSESGKTQKKWIADCSVIKEDKKIEPEIVEGQVKYQKSITENLDDDISFYMTEAFYESKDLFAWRHALVNIDSVIKEEDLEKKYSILNRIESFFENMKVEIPLFIITEKSSIEQKRIADIISSVAEIQPKETPLDSIKLSITKLKDNGLTKQQWSVLHPLFKTAKKSGIPFSLSLVPHLTISEEIEDKVFDLIDQNIDEFINSIDEEDLIDAFEDDELEEEYMTPDELNEVLSFTGRNKLKQSIKRRKSVLAVKRMKAMKRGATTDVLQRRARKLALTMLKRRLFRKAPSQMTRSEKERFERGASKRKALIDRLAQKLVSRVRMIQKQRMTSQNKSDK